MVEEKKINEAILRIAYLLAASDGNVKPDERESFAQSLRSIDGFVFGEPEANAFLESVVEDGRKLAILADFYNDEERIKAFMHRVTPEILVLKDNKHALRRAFAAWIDICISDKDYSAFEERLVKGLQIIFNKLHENPLLAVEISSVFGSIFGARGKTSEVTISLSPEFVELLGNAAMCTDVEYGENSCIPDSYIEEVKSRCLAIKDVSGKLAKSKSKADKESFGETLKFLVAAMKEFVDDVEPLQA